MNNMSEHSFLMPLVWPEPTSSTARQQLGVLLSECARMCRDVVSNFQSFQPFSLARGRDGGFSLKNGILIPESVDDPITYLLDSLYRMSTSYTAVAVTHDVYTENQPLMRIYLEHVGCEAFRVWIPWRRLGDDNVYLEQPVIQSTSPLIWPDSD